MAQSFRSFASLCASSAGGGMCPPSACVDSCSGEVQKDRFVLVDQPMTWTNARQYCKSRYSDLASIHSKDDERLAQAKCATRKNANKCVDRWVDEQTCCAEAGCKAANDQSSDGGNGCWIGLYQPYVGRGGAAQDGGAATSGFGQRDEIAACPGRPGAFKRP
jgi:hypothetical protein